MPKGTTCDAHECPFHGGGSKWGQGEIVGLHPLDVHSAL